MSSSDRRINHQQLQLLMPAKELIDMPFHEDDREWVEVGDEEFIDSDGESVWEDGGEYQEDDERFWERKLDESYTHSFGHLRDNIAESGQVKTPVKLTVEDTPLGPRQRVRQGHHRVASANEVNPSMEVPVRYVDDRGQYMPNEATDNE